MTMRVAREAYAEREASSKALIPSEHNPRDALTKIKSNDTLRRPLSTGKLSHPIKQYIIELANNRNFTWLIHKLTQHQE